MQLQKVRGTDCREHHDLPTRDPSVGGRLHEVREVRVAVCIAAAHNSNMVIDAPHLTTGERAHKCDGVSK